jgi:hypothetical protein
MPMIQIYLNNDELKILRRERDILNANHRAWSKKNNFPFGEPYTRGEVARAIFQQALHRVAQEHKSRRTSRRSSALWG